MTASARLKVGWCPGALRPMPSGDGLIVRVKPHGGTLSLEQAGMLARLSGRHGNGRIDLTGRANLQIRGVVADALPELTRSLSDLGLLDASPDAEAVRNIVTSPLAGLDPQALRDVGPIMTALERRLAADARLHGLPAKWAFVVDDGGRLDLSDVAADIRLVAAPGGRMWIGLDGGDVWGTCEAAEAVDAAVSLACTMLAGDRPSRMRARVAAEGAAVLFARAGVPCASSGPPARAAVTPAGLVGRWEDLPVFGVAAAFGSLSAKDLLSVAAGAAAAGAADIRLTPWRVLLVTGLANSEVSDFEAALRAADVITAPRDFRLGITACTGAPACHRGLADTRADASALASRLTAVHGPRPSIHVSGCGKGCAHATATDWTLVGQEAGYDLVRGGTVADAPLARGLSFNDVASWISREATRGCP